MELKQVRKVLWIVSGIVAVFLGSRASNSQLCVLIAATVGASLGLLVPFASTRVIGDSPTWAIVTLSWHLRRFRSPVDALVNSGDVERARSAIDAMIQGDDWEQFDALRLQSFLMAIQGTTGLTPELRRAAVRLVGIQQMRAMAEVQILEAVEAAGAGGDWIALLAPLGRVVREDRDYGSGTRLAYQLVSLGYSALVVGLGSAAVMLIAVALGYEAG